jgi:NADH-quinone oxidoreductase subunit C
MELERLIEEARAKLGSDLLEAGGVKPLLLRVKPERVVEAASLLKQRGFNHPLSVTGVDYPERKEIEVIYHVSRLEDKAVVALKVALSRDKPSLPSLRGVWPGVYLHERETWEMLGVRFEGHPELKRFLLQDDWEEGVYPLRRDYKLKPEV